MDWVAWAAGLYEGEGCAVYARRTPPYPRIEIAMSDEDVIQRVRDVFSLGSINGPYYFNPATHPNRKPRWKWQVNGPQAYTVARQMFPYLGVRRQAKLLEVFPELEVSLK